MSAILLLAQIFPFAKDKVKAFDTKAKPEALQEVKAAPAAKGGKGGKKEKAAPAK